MTKRQAEESRNQDPTFLRLRGSVGGLTTHARHDSHEIAVRANAGFLAKFEREVDPDGILDPAERARRADLALRAHMRALSLRRYQLAKQPPRAERKCRGCGCTLLPTGRPGRPPVRCDVCRGVDGAAGPGIDAYWNNAGVV